MALTARLMMRVCTYKSNCPLCVFSGRITVGGSAVFDGALEDDFFLDEGASGHSDVTGRLATGR